LIYPAYKILHKAKQEGVAVVAPCVSSLATIQACFEVAEETGAPVIIQTTPVHDLEEAGYLFKFYERRYPNAVVATNLDHGKDFETAARAIRAGYSSVMIDVSEDSFDENIRVTSEVVRMAHSCKVSVEAELGYVGRAYEYDVSQNCGLTDPAEAKEFVSRTGIDCLAVAIGTAHGIYKGEPRLDYDRLSGIAEMVDVPLVLHGGSNTGDKLLYRAVKAGITKVNVSTDVNNAGIAAMKNYLNVITAPNEKLTMREAQLAGKDGFKCMLRRYIDILYIKK
jgi:fructose-bisphosphate aldolase class II